MGWEVAIYRSTFDSFSSSEGATTTVDSIVEIYEESVKYKHDSIGGHFIVLRKHVEKLTA